MASGIYISTPLVDPPKLAGETSVVCGALKLMLRTHTHLELCYLLRPGIRCTTNISPVTSSVYPLGNPAKILTANNYQPLHFRKVLYI